MSVDFLDQSMFVLSVSRCRWLRTGGVRPADRSAGTHAGQRHSRLRFSYQCREISVGAKLPCSHGAGDVHASVDYYRKALTSWKEELDWIRSCTCRLRHNASLRAVAPFDAMKKHAPQPFIVSIHAASVRFRTELILMAHWPAILQHLSLVARGEDTFTVPVAVPAGAATISAQASVKEEASPFFDVLTHVKRVTDDKLLKSLDGELMLQCAQAIDGDDGSSLPFDIMHSKYADYLNSDAVTICAKRNGAEHNFGCAPNRTQILEWLRDQESLCEEAAAVCALADDDVEDSDELEKFTKRWKSIRMSFKAAVGKPVTSALSNFLHGQLYFDGRVYFRLGSKWFDIDGSFLLLADADYIICMRECGRSKDDAAWLNRKWSERFQTPKPKKKNGKKSKRDMRESRYNQLYLGRRDVDLATGHITRYLHGDESYLHLRSLMPDIELFDILKVTHEFTYAIQVKSGFASSLRDACSQVRVAVDLLTSNQGQEMADRWLANAVARAAGADDQIRQTAAHKMHRQMLRFYSKHPKRWHKLFRSSRLTFVLAFQDSTHSLEEQMKLQTCLPKNHFAKFKVNAKSISHSTLRKELQDEGYLDKKKRPTVKLRQATNANFKLPCLSGPRSDTKRVACLKDLQALFFSSCKSMVSQLELVHLHQYIKNKRCNGLLIVQIPE